MVKNLQKVAKRFKELNLNPVPVKKDSKVPLRKEHPSEITNEEINNFQFEEIGVSTGYSSLNLEVLDFDLKNVEKPKEFIKSYNKLIPKDLYDKLVIQKTISGGYHYVYRAVDIEANRKLARNKKGEATIETRGVGGYIKTYPSKGYTMVKGTFANIQIIEPEERRILFVLAKQKDELLNKDINKKYSEEDREYFKRFPKYNEDAEIGIKLLEEAGWSFHSENGEWHNLSRPDSKSKDLHGGYNKEFLFFQCFSTAQDTFEERRGYNNHHLYAELKCGGNYKKAYAKLYEDGWGKDDSELEEEKPLEFISDEISENNYLEQARKGEISMGLEFGWRDLDTNWRLKPNSFNFIMGVDNIGKSTLLSSFMVASKVLHGYKWGISSPESNVSITRRNLIEAESGKTIEQFKDEPVLYNNYLEQSRKYFYIIKNNQHYTIEEILQRGKVLYHKYGIDVLLIDPYSFYAGSGKFNEDNEVLSKIRVFSQTYCSVLVVDHPYTGYTRDSSNKDPQGFLRLPTKFDASGGNIKANRCDDFISAHRVINHPDRDIRRTIQISVQKVKDKSSGGKPHLDGEYTALIYEKRNGFTGYWDSFGDNPMYKSLVSKTGVREELKRMSTEEAFA